MSMATESLYIVPQFGKDIFVWATSAAEAREKAARPLAEFAPSANIATPRVSSVVTAPKRATRVRETTTQLA
jgi:hypothetical protein